MHAFSEDQNLKQGTVYKKTKGNYFVNLNGRTIVCSISNRLRKQLIYPLADPASIRPHVVAVNDIQAVDPVAVGDQVRFIDSDDGTGLLTEVLPRKSRLARLSSGTKPLEQVIVANLDQVVPIMAAAQPAPKWNLLDRYLASAESLDLASLICITKVDLVRRGDEGELFAEADNYQKIEYPVVLTSAVTGQGLDELREAMQGKLSVLVGKSGVGKTSLLNALQPEIGLRVNAVSSKTGKGVHTTSHLEMFELDFGGSVVDTPGMREFGLWNVDDAELALYFPEMRPLVGTCRFGLDCTHRHEPACAIRQAVNRGEITSRRYHSFLRMQGRPE